MRLKTEIKLKTEGKGCNRGSGVWRKSVDRRRERKERVTHRMALGTRPEAGPCGTLGSDFIPGSI